MALLTTYVLFQQVGLLLTLCFNEVLKVLVAEPRPHFFESCNPDLSTGICNNPHRSVAAAMVLDEFAIYLALS